MTLASPSTISVGYTLTLPGADAANWIYSDANGNLALGNGTGAGAPTGGMLVPGTAQATGTNNTFLYDVEYAPNTAGPLPGVVTKGEINNPNPSTGGINVGAKSTNAASTGVTVTGVTTTVSNSGTGIQTGLIATSNGNAPASSTLTTRYSLLINADPAGSGTTLCGMGTSTPTENLEVNGNILISGNNGLKITETAGSGYMGTATLVSAAGVSSVVVSTPKVTANSRIFVTTYGTPGPLANVGALYVTAIVPNTSFTIKSSNGNQATTVAWVIIER
jgi:hypothetical protein